MPGVPHPHRQRLSLTLEGEGLTFRGLLRAGADLQVLLDEVDRSVCRGERSVDWLVGAMRHASPATIELLPRERRGGAARAGTVIDALIGDLQALATGRKPRHFTDRAMEHAERLSDRGRTGVERVWLQHVVDERNGRLELTEQITAGIRTLRATKYRELGSIEGRLEVTSIRGSPHFSLADLVTGRSVKCEARLQELPGLGNHFGARLQVRGTVHYNSLGRPTLIGVESYRVLAEAGLPGVDDMRGLYVDMPETSSEVADG